MARLRQARAWRPSMTCTSCTTASAAAGVVKVTKPKPRGRPVCRSRITTCKANSRGGLGRGRARRARWGRRCWRTRSHTALQALCSPPRRCCHICQSDPAVSLQAGPRGRREGGLYQRRWACGLSGAPSRDPPAPGRSPTFGRVPGQAAQEQLGAGSPLLGLHAWCVVHVAHGATSMCTAERRARIGRGSAAQSTREDAEA